MEIFKKEKRFHKENSKINPNLYWRIMVVVFFVIVISAFVFGYLLFTRITNETFSEVSTPSGHIETVQKDRIEKVLSYFSDREKKSTDILNSASPVIDPSS